MRKLTIFLTFLAGISLTVYGFLLTASLKGILIMIFGVAMLVASLFLYNKRA